MFIFHIALALGLIALSAGTGLLVWLKQHAGSGLAKALAFLVIIISIVSTVCTIYCGVTYGREGYSQCMKMGTAHTMPTQDKPITKQVDPSM
jgi:hypothetical protein